MGLFIVVSENRKKADGTSYTPDLQSAVREDDRVSSDSRVADKSEMEYMDAEAEALEVLEESGDIKMDLGEISGVSRSKVILKKKTKVVKITPVTVGPQFVSAADIHNQEASAENVAEENKAQHLHEADTVLVDGKTWDFVLLTDESALSCCKCAKSFEGLPLLRTHMTKSHHTKIGFKCHLCGQFFLTQDSLSKHASKNNCAVSQYPCGKCESVFTHEKQLKAHLKDAHSLDANHFWQRVEAVQTEDPPEEILQKPVVQSIHRTRSGANNLTQNDEYSCETCASTFSHENLLYLHNKFITDCSNLIKEESLMDQDISYVTAQGETLTIKYRDLLAQQTVAPYTCAICNYEHDTKVGYKRHLATHIGKNLLTCTVCGKKFKGYETLHKHMKAHNEMPYMCFLCYAKFVTDTELDEHSEHCKKPMACDLCSFVGSSP